MKSVARALTALFLLASPALADSMVFDLPRLTWPDDGSATVSQGCTNPSPPGAAAGCAAGQ